MTLNTHPAAAVFLTDGRYRFTIHTLEGQGLRKLMTADRFLEVRSQYVGLTRPVRVEVIHMDKAGSQTWDISLSKWFA